MKLLRSLSIIIGMMLALFMIVRQPAHATDSQWRARYWNNVSMYGTPVVDRLENSVDYDWGVGSPASRVSADSFSARWTRFVNFAQGKYRFTATSDDGIRVYVDGIRIIDMWMDQAPTTRTYDMTLTAGDHKIRVDYYENGGGAVAKFSWASLSGSPGSGWSASYYNNIGLSGSPVVQRNDANINFDWGTGSPANGVSADNFSARWTRAVTFDAATYRFIATSDDGMRVYLNNVLIIDMWYDHAPLSVTKDIAIGAGSQNLTVEYYERGGGAIAKLSWAVAPSSATGWRGKYFNNAGLSGSPVFTRDDANINFDWGTGSPNTAVPADNFSVRWTRTVNLSAGTYRFTATSDDGMRFYLNNVLLIDMWYDHAPQTVTKDVTVGAGNQNFTVEYYERGGGAVAKFSWAAVPATSSAWTGSYFNNVSLSGSPVFQRQDNDLNFNWGNGSPDGRMPVDNFSVRWTKNADFVAGTYTFSVTSDDGVRVFVDGNKVIDIWYDHAPVTSVAAINMMAGTHSIKVEYYERGGDALVALSWAKQ